jgi:hypothetical protein
MGRRRGNVPWKICGKMGTTQSNVNRNAIQNEYVGVDLFLL